jgi:hypothetical protein
MCAYGLESNAGIIGLRESQQPAAEQKVMPRSQSQDVENLLRTSGLALSERIKTAKNDCSSSGIRNLNVPHAVVKSVEISTIVAWESKAGCHLNMKIRFCVPLGALELVDCVALGSQSSQVLVQELGAMVKCYRAILEESQMPPWC